MASNPLIPNPQHALDSLKRQGFDSFEGNASQGADEVTVATKILNEVRGSLVEVIASNPNAGPDGLRLKCDGYFVNDGTEVVTSADLFQTKGFDKQIEVVTNTGEVIKAQIEKRLDGQAEVVLKLPDHQAGRHTTLKLGSTEDLDAGDPVFLYGHRYTEDGKRKTLMAPGHVTMLYESMEEGKPENSPTKNFLDCEIAANSGLSGSPLLNYKGEVIGMYAVERDEKPLNHHNANVVFDDVSELKKVLASGGGDASLEGSSEADSKAVETTLKSIDKSKKPTSEQLEEIERILGGPITKPTVIEIGSDNCSWCKKLAPAVDKAEKDLGSEIQFKRINYEDYPKLDKLYGVLGLLSKDEAGNAKIKPGKGIPLTIFIGIGPKGEILWQDELVGYSPAGFQQFLNELITDRADKR